MCPPDPKHSGYNEHTKTCHPLNEESDEFTVKYVQSLYAQLIVSSDLLLIISLFLNVCALHACACLCIVCMCMFVHCMHVQCACLCIACICMFVHYMHVHVCALHACACLCIACMCMFVHWKLNFRF